MAPTDLNRVVRCRFDFSAKILRSIAASPAYRMSSIFAVRIAARSSRLAGSRARIFAVSITVGSTTARVKVRTNLYIMPNIPYIKGSPEDDREDWRDAFAWRVPKSGHANCERWPRDSRSKGGGLPTTRAPRWGCERSIRYCAMCHPERSEGLASSRVHQEKSTFFVARLLRMTTGAASLPPTLSVPLTK